jgi:hypothetical protein
MVLAALTGVSCAGPPDHDSAGNDATTERRDSAGIAILTHSLDRLADLPILEMDTVPVLSIGQAEGPPGVALDHVTAGIVRPDGGFLLADDEGTVLRAYDAAGRLLGSSGRRGDGPGEFRHIAAIILLPGDSVAVYEDRRVSILDPDLGFVRSISPPPTGYHGGAAGHAALLYGLGRLHAVFLETPGRRPGVAPGPERHWVVQDTLALVMLRTHGQGFAVDTLMHMPGITWQMQLNDRSGTSGTDVRFGGYPFLAAGAAGFAVAHGSAFAAHRFDVAGRPRQIVRLAVEPRPVTDQDRRPIEKNVRDFRERVRRGEVQFPGAPPGWAPPEPAMPAFADHHPLIEGLHVDDGGNLWIRPVRHIAGDRGWLVFGPDGQPRAWHRILPGEILHFGADHVLALGHGEMGTTRVVKYRIALP